MSKSANSDVSKDREVAWKMYVWRSAGQWYTQAYEGTLQIYVTAANDVRMRMDEIMIEMHSAEMIVKGTENVGKCESCEAC